MTLIWKYPLAITGQQALALPAGAQVLTAQMQRGVLTLWARGDPDAPMRARFITIVRTGHGFPDDVGTYLATVQDEGLVWHIFVHDEEAA